MKYIEIINTIPAEKKTFYSVWDSLEFCGAYSTWSEAYAAIHKYEENSGRDIIKEFDTIQRLEAIMDDDCSHLWSTLK